MSRRDDPSSKEAKLAAALRDNLRRRKAVTAPVKSEEPAGARPPSEDPAGR